MGLTPIVPVVHCEGLMQTAYGQWQRVEMDLERDAVAARSARRAVQTLVGDAPIQFVRDALVLTSELVSNAALHAEGNCHVDACFHQVCCKLVVTVTDESTEMPVYHRGALAGVAFSNRNGGYGMHLVDTLATRWGTTENDGGKSVWFELDG